MPNCNPPTPEGGVPNRKIEQLSNFQTSRSAHIRHTARETLRIEAETVGGLVAQIGADFEGAVETIAASSGRVIVTGIGKSAIVAQKIVATFNSTGTPAIFLHAADAIHGDLGMVRPEDVVLCLSKSGETAEIKVLVPMLKQLGSALIALVSQRASYLAAHADRVLYLPVPREADPNDLAPTASTAAQMAMGDALATTLLALRGFTPQDFAQYHPGGSLGKQLYLRVRDLYPANERPRVRPTTDLRTTIVEMTSKRLGCAVVCDGEDRALGIVTDGDLRRMLERTPDTRGLTAADIMTAGARTVDADTLAVRALALLREHQITQLIVVENERYVGVLHLHDLVREGII